MKTISPSLPLRHAEDSKTHDDLLMQHSLLFSEGLKELKSLKSQLYKAAELFESSITTDNRKKFVIRTLEDYTSKALINTVDHLGCLSSKVINLLDAKVDQVSRTEFTVSCIEQRFRTCRDLVDREGFSQKSLRTTYPKCHQQYKTLPGESIPHSVRHAAPKFEAKQTLKDETQQHVQSVIRDRELSVSRMCPMFHAAAFQVCFPLPAQLRGIFSSEDRTPQLLTSNPCAGSIMLNAVDVSAPLNSSPMCLHTERNKQASDINPSTGKKMLN